MASFRIYSSHLLRFTAFNYPRLSSTSPSSKHRADDVCVEIVGKYDVVINSSNNYLLTNLC